MTKRTKRAVAGLPVEKAGIVPALPDEAGTVAESVIEADRRSKSLLPDIDWAPSVPDADDGKH